jgi:flagellar biosynthesis GTPase FlhF
MRIKSYFAPSVQAAIALARKEFGDGVTLVTSQVAAPENRASGEYEVVFAVEEQTAAAPEAPRETKPETPQFSAFQDLLLQAVATRPSTEERLPEKLAHIRCCLIELGLEPALVLQVMSLVEQSIGIGPDTAKDSSQPIPDHSYQLPNTPSTVPPETQQDIVSLLQVEQESPVTVPHFGPTAAELLFAECVTKTPASGRTAF